MYHYQECGLANVFLVNGYSTVASDKYGAGVTIQNPKELHRAIGIALASKADVLLPMEIRFLRHEMNMSQRTLAEVLGISEVAARKWESGHNKISGPADRLLKLLYREFAHDQSSIRQAIDKLNQLDKTVGTQQFRFRETADGWISAA